MSSIHADDTFYSSHRFLVIQHEVENVLFRIATNDLTEHSSVFADLLQVPQPPSQPMQGESNDNPIILGQESAFTFRKFLQWRKMSMARAMDPTCPEFQASFSEWQLLFRFAEKWQMDNLQSACAKALKDLEWETPVSMIRFAVKANLGLAWALKAFAQLGGHRLPWTFDELRDEVGTPELWFVVRGMQDRAMSHRPCQCFAHGRDDCICMGLSLGFIAESDGTFNSEEGAELGAQWLKEITEGQILNLGRGPEDESDVIFYG